MQKRLSDGDLEVVDVAAGSAGTLTAPDGFVRTEEPGSGVEQLIFGAGGSVGAPDLRRAVALCTPRDAIAGIAGVPARRSCPRWRRPASPRVSRCRMSVRPKPDRIRSGTTRLTRCSARSAACPAAARPVRG
ncbi:lipoprotein [Mycobacteroides abscessus subsp. abscessus]|nr:lipoprotein [Mycobacteroides abscessus subsp. abscessus]